MLDDVIISDATRMRSCFNARDNHDSLRRCRQALCMIRTHWRVKYCKELVEISQIRLI
jgi:hypothetical protein